MIARAKCTATDSAIRRHVGLAVAGLAALIGGVGGVAVAVELSGAVVAPGAVVVDSHVKKVQHPTGGVVGEIRVRDGAKVKAGDLLLRLDETVARANLAIVNKSLDELAAREARLLAERDDAPEMAISRSLAAREGEEDITGLLQGERRLFGARLEARQGQEGQLRERAGQTREQIKGLELQAAAKADEIALIREELVGVEQLFKNRLVPITRVTQLRREETRLRGERGQLISEIAQSRGRISETAMQIIQLGQDLRSEVSGDLREIQAKRAELVERKIAAQDQLTRTDIRAPQDGVVHQLAVFTVGGVIGAAETVMLVVPASDNLLVEAKISPQDIDQIQLGQPAFIRLSSFDQRTTPELNGVVSLVPADLVAEQRTGAQYYPVHITLSTDEQAKLKGRKLVPGMPVESFVQTGYRSLFSYLTKPVSDQFARAFRQE
ncbi:HlyD family secretion protein [Methylopila capsulata]|uniref:Membrane fusion protein (MFP) family protein n=1 Tax=Methylopila capsulata TaxID=61654 RepID=A0A9W6MSA9_9HYPH|nr:HlyD family type I secretion periplasmic adaptor subunit [Methylopila capsulata]MBM7852396.1 HlyD family secretion protein [Methylopila capsulata]GLK56605.1 HlyD family type I secretion periplasmic adaptor subunit [Methylopila capsulata]